MLGKGIAPRNLGKQLFMAYAKTYLLNGLTGNTMPLSHDLVGLRRQKDVADSLRGDLGHYIASTVALGQRFWA